ncbi:DUF2817 domain-containing protein [Noviherbaspirillum sp. CPCC 100848]|uniref:DUF2817 domain-containing protein n=1 Tax=Noviherbaspirillum album TaxID=3080276 RepID=A0ABU6JFY4_9BURK|nr:DUF2817 domain-containing protein [Noviherbaspirillum sp. CPCC 100848]MEC4722584.1 DUF2817 domain-containing protein [Noviherbaspirillum sp. CPCC 100848]
MPIDDSPRLPASYAESRAHFLAMATRLGAEVTSYPHRPVKGGYRDAALSTDCAYFGPANAGRLIVIASGTHGIEGYAGAACQLHWMEGFRVRPRNPDMAWLLVHAVNPWGYLHDRRVTQEGVDLNRNFVDFPVHPVAQPSAYSRYHDMLVENFRPLPQGILNEARLLAHGLTSSRRRALQAAITAGQHDRTDGLFYGGLEPTSSRNAWEAIVRSNALCRRQVFLLDLHTGLGSYGEGELISYLPPDAPDFKRMSSWFNGELKSMAGGESVSAAVDGTLTAAFDRMVSSQSYAVGLEFGTAPALKVLNALRFDQWYHNHEAQLPASLRDKARERMRAAFASPERQWLNHVLTRFDEVSAHIEAGLLSA